jgi:iron complex transport system substrate-binding protein
MRFRDFCNGIVALILLYPWIGVSADFTDDHRVITLSPHLAELVSELGLVEQVVGVSVGTNYPESLNSVPVVGSASSIDFEKVLSLEPTLILAWKEGNKKTDIEKLRSLGMDVRVLSGTSFRDVLRSLRYLGTIFDLSEKSRKIIASLSVKAEALRSPNHSAKRNVFVSVWNRPIFTIGGSHLINDGLSLCGAKNVAAEHPFTSGVFSPEQVLLSGANFVLELGSPTQGSNLSELFSRAEPFGNRPPVFITGDPDLLTRGTPRFLDGVTQMCQTLTQ